MSEDNAVIEKMLEQDHKNGQQFGDELMIIIKKYKLDEILGRPANQIGKTMVEAVMKEGIK